MSHPQPVRSLRQHMTHPNKPTQPYFSVTYREIATHFAVNVHSLVLSGEWRTQSGTNFMYISQCQIDDLSASSEIVADHLNNMFGYAEYTAKVKFSKPVMTVDEHLCDDRLQHLLERRGYKREGVAWIKRLFRE